MPEPAASRRKKSRFQADKHSFQGPKPLHIRLCQAVRYDLTQQKNNCENTNALIKDEKGQRVSKNRFFNQIMTSWTRLLVGDDKAAEPDETPPEVISAASAISEAKDIAAHAFQSLVQVRPRARTDSSPIRPANNPMISKPASAEPLRHHSSHIYGRPMPGYWSLPQTSFRWAHDFPVSGGLSADQRSQRSISMDASREDWETASLRSGSHASQRRPKSLYDEFAASFPDFVRENSETARRQIPGRKPPTIPTLKADAYRLGQFSRWPSQRRCIVIFCLY